MTKQQQHAYAVLLKKTAVDIIFAVTGCYKRTENWGYNDVVVVARMSKPPNLERLHESLKEGKAWIILAADTVN